MMDGAEDEEYSSLSIVLLSCLVDAVYLGVLLFQSKDLIAAATHVVCSKIKVGGGNKRPPVRDLDLAVTGPGRVNEREQRFSYQFPNSRRIDLNDTRIPIFES